MCTKGFKHPVMVFDNKDYTGNQRLMVYTPWGGYIVFGYNANRVFHIINDVIKRLGPESVWHTFLKRYNMNVLKAFCAYIAFNIQHNAILLLHWHDEQTLEHFRDANPWYREAEDAGDFEILDRDIKFLTTQGFSIEKTVDVKKYKGTPKRIDANGVFRYKGRSYLTRDLDAKIVYVIPHPTLWELDKAAVVSYPTGQDTINTMTISPMDEVCPGKENPQ